MMDSYGLASMELQAEGDVSSVQAHVAPVSSRVSRTLRAVPPLPTWYFLESSREWYWRDLEGRYWLVHSSRRGVALPQMEFWLPPEMKRVNPRSRKGPQVPKDALGLVESLGG
jgi:hypothetical protein